jgi:phosphoglycolate phosphatase-like HAD superfamily hydrolase
MWLVLFDIDDTLTRSTHTDDIFVRVMSQALGVEKIDTEWGIYPHATDSSISRTLLERHAPGFSARHQQLLHDEFIEALAEDDQPIDQVPGASQAIEHALAEGHAVGFATGNWDEAGRIKLRRSGLATDHLPLAGATGIEARDAIMAEGVRRAQSAFGVPSFERIVYVGDAAWDVAASRTAHMPLIGISDPEERLLSQGVSHVLPNYQDLNAFQDAVHNARVP